MKTTAVGVGATALAGFGATEVKAQLIPVSWDKVADVVVVGTGCGLAGAIEAKVAGSDVLIIEAADHVGGLYIAAGGSCTMGGNNVAQQRDGIVDDDETWFQDEMWSNEYRGQPEIMRTLVARGADTVKWLQDLGFVWAPVGNGVLRPPVRRGLSLARSSNYPGGSGSPNSGIAWTHVMKKRVDELGIPILLNHTMTRIYRQPDGPVVGIEAQTPQGTINIKARKGVLLATGGWTDNYRMCQAWDPRIVGTDSYSGDGAIPVAEPGTYARTMGDGLLFAQEIGAGLSDMSFVSYIYFFFGSKSYWGWGPEPYNWETNANYASGKGLPLSGTGMQRVILVKNDGSRYINEAERARTIPAGRGAYSENPELPWTAAYLSLPEPRNVWAITDADGATALNWTLDMFTQVDPKVGRLLDPTCLAVADTIEELASKIGVPATGLAATISKYNGFVDAGKDADFGKTLPMFKLTTPAFFAAKMSLIRHTQRNGLRVNTKSQVLEQSDQFDGKKAVSIDAEKTIPHLYAAGEVANSLGYRRVHNSLGHYVTVARIAGEQLAKETPVA
ncbi:MAG: FAD-dependent oxidoreductase [Acidobacteria bacterium]|nr:FAD-dependent oxidoreductase [Acidobacteriota bacterium]